MFDSCLTSLRMLFNSAVVYSSSSEEENVATLSILFWLKMVLNQSNL